MPITAEGWGWRHATRSLWAVRDLSFEVADGERVLLLGASGSGKSTLLHAMAGVIAGDEGEQQGRLLIDGRHPTRCRGRIGLVQQDPESSVVLERVGDDVAFGCENLQVPREQIWPRVRHALDEVGLDVTLDRPTAALSGGQKQRLALAGAIAMQADILLLDEPTANLDPEGITEVTDAVARLLADRTRTLVVVEHRVDTWLDLVDRVIVLGPGGKLIADGPARQTIAENTDALLAAGIWVPGTDSPVTPLSTCCPQRSTLTAHEAILSASDLTIGRSSDRPVQSGLDLALAEGASTVLTGPNGVGKSTLALTIAGLLAPLDGRVTAAQALRPPARKGWRWRHVDPANPATWASRDLTTRIGTVFQQPEHQFVSSTVRDELAAGPRALGWNAARIDTRVRKLMEALNLTALAQANPFTLSGGEKRRLSVATVLATGPRLIFLDEPTFGQDRTTWAELVRLIQALVADGASIVSVTHDTAYIEALGQHHLHLTPTGLSTGVAS